MTTNSVAQVGSDELEIQRTMEAWHQRTAVGDLDGILGLMTDDAVFLRCGHPPMSKAEFAAGFREWAAKTRLISNADVKDIHASGDVAYVWSYISVVMTPVDGGRSIAREGHALSVFRKSSDGVWLLARDANLIPATKLD
jgi:uncharacterized protein (TIGR02246 family)